jgi:hypothetical protein
VVSNPSLQLFYILIGVTLLPTGSKRSSCGFVPCRMRSQRIFRRRSLPCRLWSRMSRPMLRPRWFPGHRSLQLQLNRLFHLSDPMPLPERFQPSAYRRTRSARCLFRRPMSLRRLRHRNRSLTRRSGLLRPFPPLIRRPRRWPTISRCSTCRKW